MLGKVLVEMRQSRKEIKEVRGQYVDLYKKHTKTCDSIREEIGTKVSAMEAEFKALRDESLAETAQFQAMLDGLNE